MSHSRLQNYEERVQRFAFFRVTRLRDRSNPLEVYSEYEFRRRFRLSRDATMYVVSMIADKLSSPLRRGTQLPPMLQFLVFIRFCAEGSFQLTVGDLQNLSQGTVSKIVARVGKLIAGLYKKFVTFPSPQQAVQERRKFYEIGGFPGVVGAIDCTHVKINSVGGENAELFRNRKGYFSINVQAICTADLRFTNVVCRWYGSAHDSRILENSQIFGKLERAEAPSLLLGDGGYMCTPFLMTPFDRPNTPAQMKYNEAQIKTRNSVERAFGVLKQRFNCIRHLRLKLSSCLTVSVACFVLHNIAVQYGLELDEDVELEEDDEFEPEPPTIAGMMARQRIVDSHFS